jgi:hypothetical protein
MTEAHPSLPRAGKDFRWENIAGFFLRLQSFIPFAQVEGRRCQGTVHR